MDEFVEFENERTGKTRKFPLAIYEAMVAMVLRAFPPNERERVEAQVGAMVADYLDRPEGTILRAAAAALYPEMDGLILNSYSPEVIHTKLQAWANQIYARYGAGVYLVGSAMTGAGRDVDIRVALPDHDFEARFPTPEALALEEGKQGRIAALFGRMNVDFQIEKISEAWVHQDKPRLRLDSVAYPEAKEPPKTQIGDGS